MKNFSKIKLIAFLITITASYSISFAQTKTVDEHHVSITKHHGEVKKHVTDLHKSTTKQEKINHADSIGTHLAAAHKEHTALHSKLTPAQQQAAKTSNEALAKHHAAAIAHQKQLKDEVSKTTPDEVKVKEHSSNVQKETESAEKAHSDYKIVTKTK